MEAAALRLIPRQRPSNAEQRRAALSSAVPATPPVALAIMSDEIEVESDGALSDADDIASDIESRIESVMKARARRRGRDTHSKT